MPNLTNYKKLWQIWIDTGGTFTDGLATSPTGKQQRCKILSSSALRGTIIKQRSANGFAIAHNWQIPAHFLNGFQFHLLGIKHQLRIVRYFDAEKNILELDHPMELPVPVKSSFEVVSHEEAPILAARLLTQTASDKPLPELNMRLATTRGTNALLERKGAPVILFITEGFTDLLSIGTQQRPDIFALEIIKPSPLYESVVAVEERLNAQGEVLIPLNIKKIKAALQKLVKTPNTVAAVALMHSYLNPEHENALKLFLSKQGFKHISCSSEIAPFIKIVPRAETTVVNAFLTPIIKNYLEGVTSVITKGSLHIMTSTGGLVTADDFSAKDCLLSGPAGGVVGAAMAGKKSGFHKIIAFDMGGTSTDVARFDGDYDYVFEHQVGDAHLVGSALAIESVAAGGGSICHFDGFRLQVGPESGGADPGPACYGAGGPLTLTDVNLLLGRLDPERFHIPISKTNAEETFLKLKKHIQKKTGKQESDDILLSGFLKIANECMADAIRKISIRKGVDPKEYTMVSFGGAGGQHACNVAQLLDISHVLIPQDASLLSAHGIGHALLERFAEKQLLKPMNEVAKQLHTLFDDLTKEAAKKLLAEGVPEDEMVVRRKIINARFLGQDAIIPIDYEEAMPANIAFEKTYLKTFGHLPEGRDIEIESLRVVCSTKPFPAQKTDDTYKPVKANPHGFCSVFFEKDWRDVPFFERSRLQTAHWCHGPAVIFEQHTTTIVETGWQFEIDAAAAILLKRKY